MILVINKAAYDTLKTMQISNWQEELKQSLKNPLSLLEQLELSPGDISLAGKTLETFPVRVPLHFFNRIIKQDPDDPLLRQVLPVADEDADLPGYIKDPLGEWDKEMVPGVLHKYQGRVLLITTGVCAIHCRYCFRRHFPYTENNAAKDNWLLALEYIRNDQSITEVILSGGDPLILSDEKLNNLIIQLNEITHLKRLRIHSRMPLVVPSRITTSLLDVLSPKKLKTVLVIHSNHANEIDESVAKVLTRIQTKNITLLNQSVLLKGVNDKTETLVTLSERLFENGVLPYYLHMLDKVAGAGHFNVSIETAQSIMHELRKLLPGYLVPKLVKEMPGEPYKIPIL